MNTRIPREQSFSFIALPIVCGFSKGIRDDDPFQSSLTEPFRKESQSLQSHLANPSHKELYKLAGRHIKYRSPYVNPFFN